MENLQVHSNPWRQFKMTLRKMRITQDRQIEN